MLKHAIKLRDCVYSRGDGGVERGDDDQPAGSLFHPVA